MKQKEITLSNIESRFSIDDDSIDKLELKKNSSSDLTKIEEEKGKACDFESYATFGKHDISDVAHLAPPTYREKHRFAVLILACMLLFGGYFCMDQPNALSKYIQDSMTGSSSMKYNMLYSFYSYPNIILPFFGGIFVDKLGLKAALNILFALCIIGQGLFVLGGYIGSSEGFAFAIIGRTFFGMGNESLAIIQSVFANRWFKGKELAFALALSMSIGRLGSTSNNFLMPVIASGAGLGTALLFGLGLIVMSYVLGVILLRLENNAQKSEPVVVREEAQENVD